MPTLNYHVPFSGFSHLDALSTFASLHVYLNHPDAEDLGKAQ